ncbi:MAG TPA: SIR2 family protein [Planktothrix sp.]|jgi:hypothetical protein
MRTLAEAVAKKKVILFAGSGVSTSIGLPTSQQLLKRLAVELGLDPGEFVTMGELRELAEYYTLEKGSLAPLRGWLDVEWHSSDIDISKSPIHNLLLDLDFPIIYTTNYDRWLERAFEARQVPYTKITHVRDMINIKPQATQIIKFHGDFDDVNSLVFAESTYLERLELESPLDIKLRADILGKSLLFLGSSLTDINLRFLLYKLAKLWNMAEYSQNRPNSYFFMAKPNVVQERILNSRGIISIAAQTPDPSKSLEIFLTALLEEVQAIRKEMGEKK